MARGGQGWKSAQEAQVRTPPGPLRVRGRPGRNLLYGPRGMRSSPGGVNSRTGPLGPGCAGQHEGGPGGNGDPTRSQSLSWRSREPSGPIDARPVAPRQHIEQITIDGQDHEVRLGVWVTNRKSRGGGN